MARLAATAAVGLIAASVCGCGDRSRAVSASTPAASPTGSQVLPGTGRPLVTIGDKNFTEQFVLGELYAQALSARGFTVQLNRNIGPTEVTLQALYSGRLSMYPEYVGVWNSTVAGYTRSFRSRHGALLAARRYARAHGLSLLRPTPFSDNGAIAVTDAYANGNGLRTLGDLRKVAATLTLGGAPQFEQSPSGLPALEQAYGFVPAAFKPLEIGNQYQALDQGTVQAAEVNSTDGQLDSGRYTLLRDPQRVFGSGQVVPVVPDQVVAAEGPAFAATVNHVSGLLTLPVVRQLNADVDIYQQDPKLVAQRFLQAHGLLPAAHS